MPKSLRTLQPFGHQRGNSRSGGGDGQGYEFSGYEPLDLAPRAWRGFSQGYRKNLPCVALRGFWDVLSIWELSGLVFDLIV